MNDRCLIVIPARLASTRLPEKLLRRAGGKSILEHTWRSACQSQAAESVVIAVDHERLADEAESFGARWVMTREDCPSGTDRIAEVAAMFADYDVFVNVQGDEPEIAAAAIDLVASALIQNPLADIATIATPIRRESLLEDPACVKIVIANPRSDSAIVGQAVYFSRAAVPHLRGGISEKSLAAEPPIFWHHLGLYAYRRDFLSWFADQPPSSLELTERLEQLRAIEAGKKILVARVETAAAGIDTEADFQAFERRLAP